MQHADKGNAGNLDGTGLRIGIVQARFNEGITNALASACRAELAALGVAEQEKGVAVLLNCGETGPELLAQFEGTARAAQAPERGRMDLRTYGIGAQILRDCGVHRMQLMGTPRRMPSMAGYGLEITGYLTKE